MMFFGLTVPQQSLAPGSAYSDDIDTSGYWELFVIASVGTMTAGASVSVQVQETKTPGSAYTDIDGALIKFYEDASNALRVGLVRIGSGRSRYLRIGITVDGSASPVVIHHMLDRRGAFPAVMEFSL